MFYLCNLVELCKHEIFFIFKDGLAVNRSISLPETLVLNY